MAKKNKEWWQSEANLWKEAHKRAVGAIDSALQERNLVRENARQLQEKVNELESRLRKASEVMYEVADQLGDQVYTTDRYFEREN